MIIHMFGRKLASSYENISYQFDTGNEHRNGIYSSRCRLWDMCLYIRLTSLALWQSNDCPSASKATLVNMGKCIMWIHYEWLHNHNKAKHNKTVCKFLGIYCSILSLLHMHMVHSLHQTQNFNWGESAPCLLRYSILKWKSLIVNKFRDRGYAFLCQMTMVDKSLWCCVTTHLGNSKDL